MNRFAFRILIATILAVIAGGITSCKYDDSELWNEVRDHENRIAQLESLCSQMNTNISSLQTIVAALQDNDYVTSITPVTSGGETIGYTINFSKSGPVTIYHGNDGKDGIDGTNGTDGQDGHTPIIGVRQSSDGNYYWTLDGNWLLDDDGNKIKANGTDGKDGVDGENGHDGNDGSDGITPQLKIEEGYWFISYDNGNSWDQLGKATGENGNDGKDGIDGDSMFSKVTYDEEFVYLVLADNVTTLIIPRRSNDFDLQFVGDNNLVCSSGETVSVSYTLTYGNENTEVAAIPHGGWEAKVEKTGNTSGIITVTAPNPMKNGEVIVLASDGQGKTIMKKLVFEEGVVSIVTKSYVADSDQTIIEVNLSTNLNYTVSIPDDAKSWISVSDIHTKATMRNDVVLLDIAANIGNSTRTANVSFVNSANEVLNTITVSQTGATIADNEIWYISADGNIIEPDTYSLSGTILSNTYGNGKGVIVFEDDVTEIWNSAFNGKSNLIGITLPAKVTIIGNEAFRNSSLVDISIPEGVTSIGTYAFWYCDFEQINIPSTVKSIGTYAFCGCSNLAEITIPEGVTKIENSTFAECMNLTKITIPNSITNIGNSVFTNCHSLVKVTIPQNILRIGIAFLYCNSLETIYNKSTIPPTIYDQSIGIPAKTTIYVPTESVEAYKSAEGWSQYASQIVGYDFTE
ncbi:MAG: leucine-rich repeat protein [Bacteroidetes bacterium]|uniref:Leucine-rich repeat protein n=1 Tax=Candidatus Cryptobacteroides faecipullorum TaxID=2840764 RepID=A0A9D9I8V8_9BACT|nr:leucine-rich repeat protein [Candidatus Cryptobacteroides faecipullorum]